MAANTKIADYTFAPWRMRDGKYVVASEATWRKPARWNRGAADGRHRPRVLLTCDVFEDWTGPMVDSQGHRLNLVAGLGRIPWIGGSDTERPANVTMADVRARLFALIDATPNLDWILLTKRPENIARMLPKPAFDHAGWNGTLDGYWHQMDKPRPNLWLGVSVENQQAADERIPHLIRVPTAVRFLSCEPILGPVDLTKLWLPDRSGYWNCLTGKLTARVKLDAGGELWAETEDAITGRIGWVIVGGESGTDARPMHPDWARSLRDQCQAAGVPFFFKQWGEYFPCSAGDEPGSVSLLADGSLVSRCLSRDKGFEWLHARPFSDRLYDREDYQWMRLVGKKAAGRLLDGREWNEFPAVEAAS